MVFLSGFNNFEQMLILVISATHSQTMASPVLEKCRPEQCWIQRAVLKRVT